jgi:hypothetical protein
MVLRDDRGVRLVHRVSLEHVAGSGEPENPMAPSPIPTSNKQAPLPTTHHMVLADAGFNLARETMHTSCDSMPAIMWQTKGPP